MGESLPMYSDNHPATTTTPTSMLSDGNHKGYNNNVMGEPSASTVMEKAPHSLLLPSLLTSFSGKVT